MKNNYVHFDNIREEGICYPTTNLLFSGTKFQEEIPLFIRCEEGTSANVCVTNSMNKGICSKTEGNVTVRASDVVL